MSNGFQWTPQPSAAALINQRVSEFLSTNDFLSNMANRMRCETGTRLIDWIDHLTIGRKGDASEWTDAGFSKRAVGLDYLKNEVTTLEHKDGLFPEVCIAPTADIDVIGIQVGNVQDAAKCWNPDASIIGDASGPMAVAILSASATQMVTAVQRSGYADYEIRETSAVQKVAAAGWLDKFCQRQRDFPNDEDGFRHCKELVSQAIDELGRDWACELFFEAERRYWEGRNLAARVQRARQDALGLGWGNHDHHTFRCSRAGFSPLISILETLGFECRERFYAGKDAGWGAQVLQQPVCGLVVFADVDLSEEEVSGDFAHEPLAERETLGTVGLWCQLHGEAILQAGLHHLECQFDFDEARSQLDACGIPSMAPFTDMAHLKQAFTKGETWQVIPDRVDAAVRAGLITQSEADRFLKNGAIGSHLEILERNDGFCGFNQTGISHIITETDPRSVSA